MAFLALAVVIFIVHPATRIDVIVRNFARAHRIDILRSTARAGVHAVFVLAPATAVVTATALSWRERSWRPIVGVLAAMLGVVLVRLLKLEIHRDSAATATYAGLGGDGDAFPSLHGAAATVFFGYTAFVVSAWQPAWRRHAYRSALAVVVVTGLALVYRPSHWLSDVIAGVAVGTVLLCLVPRPLPRRPRALASTPVTGVRRRRLSRAGAVGDHRLTHSH